MGCALVDRWSASSAVEPEIGGAGCTGVGGDGESATMWVDRGSWLTLRGAVEEMAVSAFRALDRRGGC